MKIQEYILRKFCKVECATVHGVECSTLDVLICLLDVCGLKTSVQDLALSTHCLGMIILMLNTTVFLDLHDDLQSSHAVKLETCSCNSRSTSMKIVDSPLYTWERPFDTIIPYQFLAGRSLSLNETASPVLGLHSSRAEH